MTAQNPDSNLKEQDYGKWVKSQCIEGLEKELRTLELQRLVFQNQGPEVYAELTQEEQEEWLGEWLRDYEAELAAATTLEEKKKIQEKYEGPRYDAITERCIAQEAAELLEKPASLQAGIDPAESEIPPWLAKRAEVNVRIRIVERELNVRRNQELWKGEAASALARAQKPLKPPAKHLLLTYRSQLKRAILVQLTQNPRATDLDICRGLDADGAVELPGNWKKVDKDSGFAHAYMDSNRRHKLEIEISKVRSDLRKRTLLPPR